MASRALKHEINAIVDALPETATLADVVETLHARQIESIEDRELAAQERDPESRLNAALLKAAQSLDAGLGVPHDDVLRRYATIA